MALLCLILGILLSLSWITDDTRRDRLPLLGPDQRSRIAAGTIDLQEEFRKLSVEVAKLREENTKLENAIASEGKQATVLNERLQEVKAFAGLTEVVGPGITITLRDGAKSSGEYAELMGQIIHDGDVLRVVNELWSSGAEAISVNGHRVVSTTWFRCVGPVIHVQGVPVSSPVVIRAIGDAKTLLGAMNLPGGVLSEIRQDSNMVQIEMVDKHRFEAFTGSTSPRFMKVPQQK